MDVISTWFSLHFYFFGKDLSTDIIRYQCRTHIHMDRYLAGCFVDQLYVYICVATASFCNLTVYFTQIQLNIFFSDKVKTALREITTMAAFLRARERMEKESYL